MKSKGAKVKYDVFVENVISYSCVIECRFTVRKPKVGIIKKI